MLSNSAIKIQLGGAVVSLGSILTKCIKCIQCNILYLYVSLYMCVRLWYVLSCLWDDAYKRALAANQKQ